MLGEDHRVSTESGSFVDQKTAVTIKQRGPVAIQLEAFLENQKHGDTGLILRRVPDLPHLKLRRIDRRLHARPDVLVSGGNVVAKDGGWLRKRRERIKSFVTIPAPGDRGHRTQRWK